MMTLFIVEDFMSIEDILLNFIDCECDICRLVIKSDVCCLMCCNTLFHLTCITENERFSLQCPRCGQYYATVNSNPLTTYLTNKKLGLSEVYDLYARIYKSNPRHLRRIDHQLRRSMSSEQYNQLLVGYYSTDIFSFNLTEFNKRWDNYTYGIFRSYDWKHTVATGHILQALINGRPIVNDSYIYFIIYNPDYRVVRKQTEILVKYIENTISEKCLICLLGGLIIICIPGMERKIAISLEYISDPFWLMYCSVGIETYGCFYNGVDTYMTVKAAVEPYRYVTETLPAVENNILAYLTCGYRESIDDFTKKIGINFIHGSDQLFGAVYMHYNLHIIEHNGIDAVKQSFIKQILDSDLNELVDIIHSHDDTDLDNGKLIDVRLISEDGKECINLISIITLKEIKSFVKKVLYKRMQHTRCSMISA